MCVCVCGICRIVFCWFYFIVVVVVVVGKAEIASDEVSAGRAFDLLSYFSSSSSFFSTAQLLQ